MHYNCLTDVFFTKMTCLRVVESLFLERIVTSQRLIQNKLNLSFGFVLEFRFNFSTLSVKDLSISFTEEQRKRANSKPTFSWRTQLTRTNFKLSIIPTSICIVIIIKSEIKYISVYNVKCYLFILDSLNHKRLILFIEVNIFFQFVF